MSHEPECPPWVVITGSEADCICTALRACEQRITSKVWEASGVSTYRYGYTAGVQAARDAVAALSVDAYCGDWCVDRVRDDALAAIDALRGEV